MKSYFFADNINVSCFDIVIYEKLNDSIIHIGVDEPNALFNDKRIITHHYIDLYLNTNIYSWIWPESKLNNICSFAEKSIDSDITITIKRLGKHAN